MSKKPTTELALVEAINDASPAATLTPTPGTTPALSNAKAALRRCSAAWQRAFEAYMETSDGDGMSRVFAAHKGNEAYRHAMPLLSSSDGVRDFIACTAHGILIGAISPDKSSRLLYAAQVALSVLHFERKPSNPDPK